MDVWRITVAALRRWYVLLPLLALTAALAWGAGQGVKEEYEVTGAAMIVPGRTISIVPNPYGSPADANNAVSIVLNSPEARRAIASQGLVPTFEVAPQSRSTIMNFRVRADSPQIAVDTGMAVFRMAAVELNDRQEAAGIRLVARYSVDVLQAPSVSAAVRDGRTRNMAVVGLLGGALSLLVAVFFDDVVGLVRRRKRRSATDDSAADDSGADDSAADDSAADGSDADASEAGDPEARETVAADGVPAGDRS